MILFDDQASHLRWLGIESPTSADVQHAAQALGLGLDQLHLDLDHNRRPGLLVDDRALHLTLRTLSYDDANDAVESGQVDVITDAGRIVVIHQCAAGPERSPGRSRDVRLPSPGPDSDPVDAATVTVRVLDAVIAGHELVVEELAVDVEEIEVSIFSPGRTSDAERIYLLRREVAEVRRAAQPLVGPLMSLTERAATQEDDVGPLTLRAMTSRVQRIVEQVETLDHMLTAVFDAHVAQISLQQNEDMRKISAAAALVVVPTLVAGIYGMNFTHMPELGWTFGYPVALGFMGLVVTGLYVAFKISGWL